MKKIFIENINNKKIENNDMTKILSPFFGGKTKEEIKKILDVFNFGFKKYKFKNNRHNYEIIKYLSFIQLCIKNIILKDKYNISVYFTNFKEILNSIINLEYIDRIKVLLGFLLNLNDNLKKRKKKFVLTYDKLILFDLDDKESNNEYPYIKEAYILFYMK